MKRAMVISLVGHGAVLLWALVTFATPRDLKPADSMPVDIISADEFTKLTAGAPQAPPAETPKPVVEKIGEAKPVEDPIAKVVEKKQVVAAAAETPPTPEPKPKVEEPKPAAAPEQKPDPIAEALKKDEAKKPEKKAETKPEPVKKPVPQQPKFDPRKTAALLNKLDPERHAATGATLNSTASAGAPGAIAPQLSQDELGALTARIRQCWTIPPGAEGKDIRVEVRMLLRPNGSLQALPVWMNRNGSPLSQAVAESGLRAINLCAPYDFLPAVKYEHWKDVIVVFDADWVARM